MRPPKMMPIYIKLFNSQVYSSTLTGNIPESWSKCAKCAKGKGKGEGLQSEIYVNDMICRLHNFRASGLQNFRAKDSNND